MQACLDRAKAKAQLLGRLFGIESFNVAEEEYLSVRDRQPVDTRSDVCAGLGLSEPCQGLIRPGPDRATVVSGFVESRQQVLNSDLPAPRLAS